MYKFAFQNRLCDQKGNPLMIKGGALLEYFDPKPFDKEVIGGEWNKSTYSLRYPAAEALAFPKELWLNTGERKVSFDFRIDFHGIIFSQSFFDRCRILLENDYKVAKLNIVNRKGANIAADKMYYAKCREPQFVVDNSKSDFSSAIVKVGIIDQERTIVRKLHLKEDLDGDFIEPIDLENCILFSQRALECLGLQKFTGLELTPLSGFVAKYNDRFTFRRQDGSSVSAFI